MSKRTKPYAPEFKEQVVREILDRSRPHAEVAEEFGVPISTVGRWVKTYRDAHAASSSVTESDHSQERVRELEKELREVRAERDLLKKKQPPSSPATIGN